MSTRRGPLPHLVLGLACLLLAVLVGASAADAPAADQRADSGQPTDVYVDVGDCDEQASGLSSDEAVCSLEQANERLLDLSENGQVHGDVDVRIAPGVYESGPIEWTYNPDAEHTLRFLPSWQQQGTAPDDDRNRPRPVIRGNGSASTQDEAGFTYRQEGSERTGPVEFHHLQFEQWGVAGLIVYGGVDTNGTPSQVTTLTAPPIQDVVIRGNVVRDVGSIALEGTRAEAGIGISNTHNAVIRDNVVKRVANVEGEQETYAHAVYLRRSTSTRITGNEFSMVSGDAIRIRDQSDNSRVWGNTYERAGGINGAVGLYFRDIRTAERDEARSECESRGTDVAEADPGTNWDGEPQQAVGGIYNRPHLQLDTCHRGGASGS
ncbi:MAG TPA: right-handed parallel beta-helix repeat-containing protein [Jiangellaceae bacterium]|nr:right-handed parallel beta-helix repeat-containing protein [Jiangellaceae bacterium]